MYAVIMAGGVGTRFWPRSRIKRPKQLLNIVDDQTMIQATVNRLESLIPHDKIFIVTTKPQKDELQKQLPILNPENLITEPKGKNTAPCIGLAAIILKHKDPEAVMAVLPADHRIGNDVLFRKVLSAAEALATRDNCLVTLGIDPTYPSTGYGYIQTEDQIEGVDGIQAYKVKTFAEKPDHKTAERFLNSGDFFWNSGMFIWKAETILKEIEKSLPDLFDGLMEIEKYLGKEKEQEVIQKVYCQIKNISIDYGVMEHSQNVFVLKGEFEWNDVGSWDEVYKISPKDPQNNVLVGEHFLKNSTGCYIDSPKRFVAAFGIEDLIVVETDDALLICPRNEAQNVKALVDAMNRKKLDQYL
jgi:mannose-1-phosphate guanylyltransferase